MYTAYRKRNERKLRFMAPSLIPTPPPHPPAGQNIHLPFLSLTLSSPCESSEGGGRGRAKSDEGSMNVSSLHRQASLKRTHACTLRTLQSRQSGRLFIQSSEFRLLAGESVSPSLWFRGGGTHSLAGVGARGSQFGRGDQHCGTLGIYVLCGVHHLLID
jgi:hypothetical protein